MDLTRKQVIEELEAILEMQYWNVPLSKAALEYAISSLKTDEAYQLMYEGEEVYDKDTVRWMLTELKSDIEKNTMTSGLTNQGTWNECIACCSRVVQQKINALTKDCRDCAKWENCPCGKQGHENETSLGYSIGECKDFQEKTNALGGRDNE